MFHFLILVFLAKEVDLSMNPRDIRHLAINGEKDGIVCVAFESTVEIGLNAVESRTLSFRIILKHKSQG